MENFGLSSLSPLCDDLSEFDSPGCNSSPVEELNCDPYLPAYADAIFQALYLDGPQSILLLMRILLSGSNNLSFNSLLHFSSLGTHSELLRDLSTELTQGMPLPFPVTHTRKAQLTLEQFKQKSNGCSNSR